jgi:hypothetical protein
MISPDKSGETLEKGLWMARHLDLSLNFFGVSLLIVRFFMTQIKYKIFDL